MRGDPHAGFCESRGVRLPGHSPGASATVDDLAHDAAAAVAALQAHPRVTAVPEAGNILAAGVTTANVIKIKHQAI